MSALPRVLGTVDLPLAELAAARLDGELFPLARGWLPADSPGVEADRAAAAAIGLPTRWVAHATTAAWIWGAVDAAPDPARFCVSPSDRGAHVRAGVALREVPLRRGDWTVLGGVRVTTVARTLGDLLRAAHWDDASEGIALRLLDRPERADALLDRERLARLPNGTDALLRLERLSPR